MADLTQQQKRLLLRVGTKGHLHYVDFMRDPNGLELLKNELVKTDGCGDEGKAVLTLAGEEVFDMLREA